MKARCLVIVALLFPLALAMNARSTEQQIVSYAKALDVAKLDSALSSQPLDEWLRTGPPHVETLTWKMSDCKLKPDFSDPKYVAPLCAEVRFRRGTAVGWLIVRVGSFRAGISGTPQVENLLVEPQGGLVGQSEGVSDSQKLSDLPRFLEHCLASSRGR